MILAFITFSIGLGLAADDFRRVLRRPGTVLLGASLQLIALPALTWFLARSFAPMPSIALGMIVLAACPGGSLSNLMTLTARGDTALSITLTALSSVTGVLLTPLSVLFWASQIPETAALLSAIELDRGSFIAQTLLILAVPLALGMLTGWRKPRLAARLHKPFHRLSLVALGVFVIGAVAGNASHLDTLITSVVPLVALQNTLGYLLGYAGAWIARLPAPARRAFTFEIGFQNSGLGLVLVLTHFAGLGGTVLVAAGWGLWPLLSGVALTYVWSRWPPREPLPSPLSTSP